jgi:hypothetical protein
MATAASNRGPAAAHGAAGAAGPPEGAAEPAPSVAPPPARALSGAPAPPGAVMSPQTIWIRPLCGGGRGAGASVSRAFGRGETRGKWVSRAVGVAGVPPARSPRRRARNGGAARHPHRDRNFRPHTLTDLNVASDRGGRGLGVLPPGRGADFPDGGARSRGTRRRLSNPQKPTLSPGSATGGRSPRQLPCPLAMARRQVTRRVAARLRAPASAEASGGPRAPRQRRRPSLPPGR